MNDFISNISQKIDQEIVLKGWVYNFRSSGKIFFLQIRDGSGFIQAIIEKSSVDEKIWEEAQKIALETSVEITGQVTKHPKKEDVYELQVKDLRIIDIAEEYPLGKKEHGPEFLLDNRHLWLRSPKQWAIQRIRNTIIQSTYEFFNKTGFLKIDSPVLTPNACEGTTELFELEYFDQGKAYLSQSGQLYLEAAIFAHGRVFDFGPVFRAEKSKTRRHLTEFWMMDAEAAFVEHEENMRIQESLICHLVGEVLEKNKKELEILERDIGKLKNIQVPFHRMTYAEAIEELQKMGSDIKEDEDLGAEDETRLTEKYDKPIFIEKYPAKVKAFYMKRDSVDSSKVLCSDLLAPEGYGEIIGGSQREDDYELLLTRIKEHNLPVRDFQWYLDLRKYGSVPHSGFGYGLERIVTWICGIKHVRETIPFTRMIYRLKP